MYIEYVHTLFTNIKYVVQIPETGKKRASGDLFSRFEANTNTIYFRGQCTYIYFVCSAVLNKSYH